MDHVGLLSPSGIFQGDYKLYVGEKISRCTLVGSTGLKSNKEMSLLRDSLGPPYCTASAKTRRETQNAGKFSNLFEHVTYF